MPGFPATHSAASYALSPLLLAAVQQPLLPPAHPSLRPHTHPSSQGLPAHPSAMATQATTRPPRPAHPPIFSHLLPPLSPPCLPRPSSKSGEMLERLSPVFAQGHGGPKTAQRGCDYKSCPSVERDSGGLSGAWDSAFPSGFSCCPMGHGLRSHL